MQFYRIILFGIALVVAPLLELVSCSSLEELRALDEKLHDVEKELKELELERLDRIGLFSQSNKRLQYSDVRNKHA